MEPRRHSPSAMAPRSLFAWRSSAAPSSPLSSPVPAHATPDAALFSCDVWQPADASFLSFGFGAKWTKTSLSLFLSCVADGAAAPLLHLRLADRVYVVAGVHALAASHSDAQRDKRPISLDVKAPADVRRSLLYHTAAVSSVLTFFVDSESDALHLTAIIREAVAVPSPPQFSRPPSPPRPSAPRSPLRKGADVAREIERVLPAVPASPPEAPPLKEHDRPPDGNAKPAETIEIRLAGLQAFAHERDVTRAQRERRVETDDLTLRLHALRNETPTPASEESLTLRLQRLRGDGGQGANAGGASPATSVVATRTLSPVELIIQQAMDEVAMGLTDEIPCNDVEGESYSESDSDSDCCSSSSDSSSDDGRRNRRRRDPRRSNARKPRQK